MTGGNECSCWGRCDDNSLDGGAPVREDEQSGDLARGATTDPESLGHPVV
jgi:hypothetical protein